MSRSASWHSLMAGAFLMMAVPMVGSLSGGPAPGTATAGTPGDGAARVVDPVARLDGSDWQVVLAGDTALTAEDGVTLSFDAGRIAGRSGCNRFMGSYEAVALSATELGSALRIGPVAGTRMACPGRADEVEARFLGALEHVDAFVIDAAERLLLLAGRSVVILALPVSED